MISEASFRQVGYQILHREAFARVREAGLKPYVRSEPASWLKTPGSHQLSVGRAQYIIAAGRPLPAALTCHTSTDALASHWNTQAHLLASDIVSDVVTVQRLMAIANDYGVVVHSGRRAKVFAALGAEYANAIAAGDHVSIMERSEASELLRARNYPVPDRTYPDLLTLVDATARQQLVAHTLTWIHGKLLAGGLYGMPHGAIGHAGVAALVALLDAPAVKLARSANAVGTWFHFSTYERICRFRAAYEQIERDRRRMLPLFDLLLNQHSTWVQKAVGGNPGNAMRWLRDAFITAGGTPLIWRRLYNGSAPMLTIFSMLWREAQSRDIAMALLGQQFLPPLRLLGVLARTTMQCLDEHRGSPKHKTVMLERVLPAILREAKSLLDAGDRAGLLAYASEVEAQLHSLSDYLLCDDDAIGLAGPGVAWGTLVARSRAWHRDLDRRRRERDETERASALARRWLTAIDRFEEGGLVACALIDGQSLEEEAIAMDHCVDDYVAACLHGTSRIFSIRDAAGERVATAELTVKRGSVRATQVLGAGNMRVPAAVKAFADRLAKQYQHAMRAAA
ncbi:PcfJ domain-containing protein [Niveibacterium sp.]|uniref:PcfJ domain-containing protein n=1 Tax=Niveibacterium sp. TaxID=2017444 RepID=UPI0035B37E51